MSLITQIKADMKRAATKLARAKKREAKADANVRTAAGALQTARTDVKTIEAEQHKLSQMLKLEEGSPSSGKAKPGPKAKAVKAVAKPKAKKPGPKAKAAAKPAKAEKKNQSRAAQGRREVASGKRDPIKGVIAKVLGKRVMHANQVFEAIKAKGQLPNSHDPRGYIGYLLSASKITVKQGSKEVEVHQFERVPEKGRGFYKNHGVAVKGGAKAPAPKKEAKAPKAKAAPKPAKAKAKPLVAKAADKTEKKGGAPVVDGKRTVTCKVCGKPGHNSKGHDKAVAGTTTKAAPAPAKEPEKKAPKAETKAADTGTKKTVKCSECGQLGHNKKGHAKAVAAAAKTNGNGGHATPAKAEAEPTKKAEPVESKTSDEDLSTDEILKQAGIDIPAPLSPS